MMGLVSLRKEEEPTVVSLSLPHEDTARRWPCVNEEELSPESEHADTQIPELRKKCLSRTVYAIL